VALTERRQVARQVDGGRFRSEDVSEPAMDASGPDEEALVASVAAGGELPGIEVLRREVVATMVAGDVGRPVRVLTTGRLVGKRGIHASSMRRLMRHYAAAVSDLSGGAPSWLDGPFGSFPAVERWPEDSRAHDLLHRHLAMAAGAPFPRPVAMA
jgi:hypothetical protein